MLATAGHPEDPSHVGNWISAMLLESLTLENATGLLQ